MALLHFPDDKIVGTLDWASRHWDGPGLATGQVEVPDGAEISLDVHLVTEVEDVGNGTFRMSGPDELLDLGFIRALPTQAIYRLELHRRIVRRSFEAISHLAPGLRHLILAFAELDDDVLPTIARLTNLASLQTFGNRFTDAGVQELVALTGLERLYLEEETLSLAAFDLADKLPRLKAMGLQDVPISDEELEGLRARLPGIRIDR